MKKAVIIFLFIISTLLSFRPDVNNTKYNFSDLSYFPVIPETNNIPTVDGVALGRFLFYDPILSKDSTISCATCHKQKAAFSDAPNTFSVGVNGEKLTRNTLPLFNLAWYSKLFWDGRAETIEEQVFHPVRGNDEMGLEWEVAISRIQQSKFYQPQFMQVFGTNTVDSVHIAMAIAQFERTLISNNAKYDKVLRGEDFFTPDEYEGFILINDQNKGGCLHCHTTDADALGTTGKFSNNGLSNAQTEDQYQDKGLMSFSGKKEDLGKFKIPSLRNVALTPPYMHDGRFNTLEEVVDFYSEGVNKSLNVDSKMEFVHQGGARLSEEEKRNIVAFLHTLTDSLFITNPQYGNPFEK